jgi:hypothetical protein
MPLCRTIPVRENNLACEVQFEKYYKESQSHVDGFLSTITVLTSTMAAFSLLQKLLTPLKWIYHQLALNYRSSWTKLKQISSRFSAPSQDKLCINHVISVVGTGTQYPSKGYGPELLEDIANRNYSSSPAYVL